MTSKLTIAKVGGGTIDLTGFSPSLRKGAAFFDHNDPLIQLGMRCANGEASQGTFRLMDPEAELPRTDFEYNLPAHKLITWSEDASGTEVWLHRGRTSTYDGGRGTALVDNEVEYEVTSDDGNIELRGQAFVEAWDRPEETDTERVYALQEYTLNGASSTATHHRSSCAVTVDDTHLAPDANTVIMPAKTYPVGTQPQDVIQDCADTATKIYGVVIHHTGGSHLCLLYTLEEDYSYTTAVRISDNLADWDPDDLTAPVFEPHWEQGKASLYDGQQLLSGLVSVYGADASVFVEHTSNLTDYDYWVDSYSDGVSETVAQATLRASGVLSYRRLTHVTHRVSIVMLPEQVHLLHAGMAIDVKAAAMMGGQYLDTWQTRRIAECQFEPRADGRYWAHLNLDRAQKRMAYSGGKVTVPKPPVVTELGDPDYFLFSDAGSFTSTDVLNMVDGNDVTYDIVKIRGSGGTIYAAWNSPVEVTEYTMKQGFHTSDVQYGNTSLVRSGWRVYVSDDTDAYVDAQYGTWTEVENAEGSVAVQESVHSLSAGPHKRWKWVSTLWDGGGALQTDWVVREFSFTGGDPGIPPASDDNVGDTGTPGGYATGDHKHPAQTAAVTPFTPYGTIEATNVQDAIEELLDEGGGPDLSAINFLVGTASGDLSAEIVVGTTPGGELGGTWASPTVDTTHSGSAHLALGTTSSTAAAGDHTHAGGGAHILLADGRSTPFDFTDMLQMDDGSDFLWSDS